MGHLYINSSQLLYIRYWGWQRWNTKAHVIAFSPLRSFPKPMEEETFWPLLLDFSFITSSSPDTSSGEPIFFFFLFLWRGGSFLGKANIGKMTRSMAMAHKRKPLHLKGRNTWETVHIDISWEPYRFRHIFTSCQQSEGHSGWCWLHFWGRHRSQWGHHPAGSQLQVPGLPSRTWLLKKKQSETFLTSKTL